MSDLTKTGTFLTADQIEQVGWAYFTARSKSTHSPRLAYFLALMNFRRLLYDFALAQGLPEIEGWYGLDMKSGEVLGPGVG